MNMKFSNLTLEMLSSFSNYVTESTSEFSSHASTNQLNHLKSPSFTSNHENPSISHFNSTKIKLFSFPEFPEDHGNESTLCFDNSSALFHKGNSSFSGHKSDPVLYFYGTLPLIFFCIVSVAVNINILISVYWIRRPLSPTLHISLSLAGADAFSSSALGIGLVMNSFVPRGLGLQLPGVDCFLLGLEAVRLGAVMISVGHLVTLAVNHYLGILKPLHYLSIMTHRMTTFLVIVLWTVPLCFFLTFFSLIEGEGFQSQHCEDNTFLEHKKFRMMFSSLFFGPFALMVCIYAHIFCIVRKHQASRLKFSQIGSSFRCTNGSERLQNASQQMARNVKAIVTTLYILGSFVIGWMPATLLFVFVCKDCLLQFDGVSANSKFMIYLAANCLIILKTLVNPIIYAARMHEIQVATRRMHSTICGFFCLSHSSGEKSTDGLSSDVNHRASISKTRVCRLNSNASNKYPRNGSCKYSYTGFKRTSRDKTSVEQFQMNC